MITNSRQLKTVTTTINTLGKQRSNRVADANKKQIVQMLISIVVMYTICWVPTIVDELLTSFGYICRTSNSPALKHMRMGFNALTYCQSCINPILYAFISQNFRATFKSAYSRMKHRLQGVEEMRSRMGSNSSASMLSTRNHHRIYGSSFNTLTVPGRNRSPTEISRDSGRPRSPTDASLCSRTRSIIRPRSPTTTSQVSITVPQGRSRTPTGLSEVSIHLPNRTRDPVAAAVLARLEREFQRTQNPDTTTLRNLAIETNLETNINYIMNWFRERRRGQIPNVPVNPNPAPAAVAPPPQAIHFILPQPNTCYPNNLVTGHDPNANDDISAEQEAIFNSVLQIKLKCGICFSGQMTLRCQSCFKGVCNGCIVEIAKNVGGQQIACPYCRHHPNPFDAVSFPLI